MKFDLTSPCGNCPFRTDLSPYLRPEFVREILGSDEGGWWWPAPSFVCHKTVDYNGRHDSGRVGDNAQHCAGVAIILTRDKKPNDAMQLAERLLGWNARSKLDMSAPVYKSAAACIEAHEDADAQTRQRVPRLSPQTRKRKRK